jgi:lichenan operon transcriptional antiterminator
MLNKYNNKDTAIQGVIAMYSLFSVLNSLIENIADLEGLKKETGFSESKIRGVIKELRDDGQKHGFKIETIRKVGYRVTVLDEESFHSYFERLKTKQESHAENRKSRVAFILYILICTEGYCTIETIAETIGVHRKTIVNSLIEVKQICKAYDLTFTTKKHYGIKISGDEVKIRKLFSKVIVQIQNTNHGINKAFNKIKEDEQFQDFLAGVLVENDIILTSSALESVILHLSILLMRVKEKNFVTDIKIDSHMIEANYYQAAMALIEELQRRYGIQISIHERDLIAAQLFGKAVLEEVPVHTKKKMKQEIINVLSEIDQEYHTEYASDIDLSEGLLLHIYPLMIRLACDLELNNALFQTLPAQYTSSFMIAIRFIEIHPVLRDHRFSRDEIGYLALHFAGYLERKNTHYLKKIRSIVFIYQDIRSEAHLSKIKLENTFPNARVKVIHQSKITKYNLDDIELVLATDSKVNLKKEPFIINERIDENEIEKIKNAVLFNYQNIVNKSIKVSDLFEETLFFKEAGTDYLAILEKYSRLLEEKGFAKQGYSSSVLEREGRLDTVYENGLAGPHSIVPLGNVDCIVTIILDQLIHYHNKTVTCIFLINIRRGHMILHQGISQLIVRLMSNRELMEAVARTTKFEEFNQLLNEE